MTIKPRRLAWDEQRSYQLAAICSRILEVCATMAQLIMILAIVGLLGGLELDLIGLPEAIAVIAAAVIGIGAAGWLKGAARGMRHAA